MSYSPVVLDHFHNPRNQHVMADADVKGVAGDPGRGNFMVLYLQLDDGERIARASFQTHGCAPSIAAGSWLTERLVGSTLADSKDLVEEKINEALGGLPMHKRHCSALAAAALEAARNAWKERAARLHGGSVPVADIA